MADHFDEKSGTVPSKTPWGNWAQTIDEVFIEITVPKGTRGREIVCDISPKNIKFSLKGQEIFKGELYGTVLADESTWTLEDNELVRIILMKSSRDAASGWKSLLVNEYSADPWTFNEMEKKLTLERFQKENPGFDFSKADITGNYSGGGPKFPS
ncbi:nudC domain-containing protein 2-like [Stylophora pistillata]|uniref:NudC domain-containing protein 2 n=1 Tax=Stylophora pistillata TaxID=50429 RepID=A0A2B4S4V5_STYPI|nr:nudC domain-containing protein 2-like [Stylophora pistillata]PFX23552.1 NudC domain-containing protein 2 [Stylophora pistillata]